MDTATEIKYYKDTMRLRFTDFRVTMLDVGNENWDAVLAALPYNGSSLPYFLYRLFFSDCLYEGFNVQFSTNEPSEFTVFDPTNRPFFSGQILLPYNNIILFAPLSH